MASNYHLKVGSRTWCDWTGCSAGLLIAGQTGVHQCDYNERANAKAAAAKLAPLFCVPVTVARGGCPR